MAGLLLEIALDNTVDPARAPTPAPQGDPVLLAVDRAVQEMRRGRLVAMLADEATASWRLALALETALPALVQWMLGQGAVLAMTAERAAALGLASSGEGVLVPLPAGVSVQQVQALGRDWQTSGWRTLLGEGLAAATPADAPGAAALALARQAQLMPVLLLGPASAGALPGQVLGVSAAQQRHYAAPGDGALVRVSEALVPLRGGVNSRLVLYRDQRDGSEHLAILVGRPDPAQPVPVRVHSSCFTGDLLGSLRCDCGEQLHAAVARIEAAGGGVLLYLAQEGRGIGLANKLRAYQLQDEGLDTLDANRHLGFSADERDYGLAAAMLRDLGTTRILLLSNSPQKLDALRGQGIEVTAIEPVRATPNEHNARYLRTKRERAGHL